MTVGKKILDNLHQDLVVNIIYRRACISLCLFREYSLIFFSFHKFQKKTMVRLFHSRAFVFLRWVVR